MLGFAALLVYAGNQCSPSRIFISALGRRVSSFRLEEGVEHGMLPMTHNSITMRCDECLATDTSQLMLEYNSILASNSVGVLYLNKLGGGG